MFLDVLDIKYLTRNHNNNNNNKNKNNIWHLVSLVRADPAAERREYMYSIYLSDYVFYHNLSIYRFIYLDIYVPI